ncbi:hypothetical protein Hanom_Chr02g00109481 [Helianthus anomalus]
MSFRVSRWMGTTDEEKGKLSLWSQKYLNLKMEPEIFEFETGAKSMLLI